MRFLMFIYFCSLIYVILTDDYSDEDINEKDSEYDANWEIIPGVEQEEDKRSPDVESTLSSNGSKEDDSCILANIIHTIWKHLTGLADQMEQLEKHIEWGPSNDTLGVELNSTEDYPDPKGNKELDITEVKQAEKYNSSNATCKAQVSNSSRENTSVAAAKSSCNGNSCSNAMVIKTGEFKVNGTTVKQLANKMEIEKLNKWEEQIENCKKILELDPNATLEDISRMKRRKVKEIAVPMRQRYFRTSNGWRYPLGFRKKRSLDGRNLVRNKRTHKTYRKIHSLQSPSQEKWKPFSQNKPKICNYLF